jgi:hypothetical protein
MFGKKSLTFGKNWEFFLQFNKKNNQKMVKIGKNSFLVILHFNTF